MDQYFYDKAHPLDEPIKILVFFCGKEEYIKPENISVQREDGIAVVLKVKNREVEE